MWTCLKPPSGYRTDGSSSTSTPARAPGAMPATSAICRGSVPRPSSATIRCSARGSCTTLSGRTAATCRQQRDCPLCPSSQSRQSEIPASDYEVVVFENRFPALAESQAAAEEPTSELMATRPGAGRCEVICFTSDHDASFADLSPDRVRLVTAALIDRTAELSKLPGVEQVYCFENRGREIGVTQPHPHGQIYACPFVTPRTSRMLSAARAYARRTGRNLFDDLVAAERAAGTRMVRAGRHWAAFVPHAARWPYEVHLLPRAAGARSRGSAAGRTRRTRGFPA